MTDETPRPTHVRLVLPSGDEIPLELEKGPLDPNGNQVWMAYGPAGMEIPFGSRVDCDELPAGTGLGVAVEREMSGSGRVRFADRRFVAEMVDSGEDLSFEPGQADGSLHSDDERWCGDQLPEWGRGWD